MKDKTISIRVTAELHAKIAAKAKEDKRSVSQWLQILLETHV